MGFLLDIIANATSGPSEPSSEKAPTPVSIPTPPPDSEPARVADPAWLTVARKYHGLTEIRGPHHNEHILRWWKELRQPFSDDETPWCGAYVGGVLAEAGMRDALVSGPASARSWLKMPVKLNDAAYGCVVIFWRGSRDGWKGHVGFVVGRDARGNLMVLGGNQGNMVSIKPFDRGRVLGYRWPGIWPYDSRFELPLLNSDGRVSTNEA